MGTSIAIAMRKAELAQLKAKSTSVHESVENKVPPSAQQSKKQNRLVEMYAETKPANEAPMHPRMLEVLKLLPVSNEGKAKSAKELREMVGLKSRQYFNRVVLNPLLAKGYIERKIPDMPQHPSQGYFLTQLGWLAREVEQASN